MTVGREFNQFFLLFSVLLLLAVSEIFGDGHEGIVYTCDQLTVLAKPTLLTREGPSISEELRRRHCGHRAGALWRAKRRRFKPYLPTIIMDNVRALANKMNEFSALTRSQRKYRECSITCFTETWLHKHVPDSNTTVSGFQCRWTETQLWVVRGKEGGSWCLLTTDGAILNISIIKNASVYVLFICHIRHLCCCLHSAYTMHGDNVWRYTHSHSQTPNKTA